jgi:CelD/BcsL family acetyltransferase involved in cellulose biosynthesis
VLRLDVGDGRWAHFVDSSAGALPFHHPSWARLVADCYGYRAFALALTDSAGALVAGVPVVDVSTRWTGRKWVSLPFTDICPPLADDDRSLDHLAAALDAERRAAGDFPLELRGNVPGTGGSRVPRAVRHTLELDDDPEVVFRRHRTLARRSVASARRDVARARREGVTVVRASEPPDLVDAFYGLHLETRRHHGVPIQPRRFFAMLWDRIVRPGLGFCLLALVSGRPIAGAVFMTGYGTVIYKYGASDRRFLRFRPNHLVVSEAITWGCVNGFRQFDFGRTDLGNAGLRAFKSSWGAREEPLVYTVLGMRTSRRHLRPGIAHDAVGTVIRHSPRLVCRATGELFYRYLA